MSVRTAFTKYPCFRIFPPAPSHHPLRDKRKNPFCSKYCSTVCSVIGCECFYIFPPYKMPFHNAVKN